MSALPTLKQFIIEKVDPTEYYAKRFPKWDKRSRENVTCPFHEDGARPNLAVALRNGGARCHSSRCAKSIGNIIHFESELYGLREAVVCRRLYTEFIRPIVGRKTLARYQDFLSINTHYVLKIKKEMGLSYASIKRFSIGLDEQSHRITIPVFDAYNQCVNVRFYRLPSERTPKDTAKLYNLDGHGSNDLFPWPAVETFDKNQPLFIMASEKEAMLALQDGYDAIASTSGEDKWNEDWNVVARKRDVVLVFDMDAGGAAARKRVAPLVRPCAKSVTSIKLPFRQKRKDRKDYADWRLKEKHQPDELRKLVSRTIPKNKHRDADDSDRHSASHNGTSSPEGKEVGYPELPPFATKELLDVSSISSRSDLLNRRIRAQGIVAAKSPNTFTVPWKFQITIKHRPPFFYEIPMGRDLLRFVKSPDGAILQSVQNLIGTAAAEIVPHEYLTATEIEIIPTAVSDRDVPYTVQRCYYFGERIESNTPYLFDIIPTSEIRSQETIGIITKITPLSKSIDEFKLTAEMQADLSVFHPTEGEGVWDKLVAVCNEITYRHTRVYNRLDWTIAAVLTWASPIGWRFPNDPDLQRGWLNTLALGDTETGKSKVCKALRLLFNCGVFVSGENCTFAGLIGGAIKMGSGQLMLRWGRIPLSDKQLVVLEELSGLSVDEISNMSDVRSSGVARLDKGGINSETSSRTRLICLSNARSTKRSLSSYLFGVHAVHELIGHGEDIARFDLITTLTDREVSIGVINAKSFATIANSDAIATDQFQKLIHFIWALKPEQIHFTEDAYFACLDHTKRLSEIYHPSIPVFKGGSGRFKLGRIAAAIACFQFSWDDSTSRIVVTTAHVDAASRLLELIYRKPSLGYLQYSQQMFDRENVKDEALLRKTLKQKVGQASLPKVIESLLHATRFSNEDLCAIAGTQRMHADQLIGVMLRERAIKKGEHNVWEITPAGKTFFEKFHSQL